MPRFPKKLDEGNQSGEEELGGQISFLEHLDELRKRLIRCFVFMMVASFSCWFLSNRIYNFLAKPVQRALADARQRRVAVAGLNGPQSAVPLSSLKPNDKLRFVFPKATRLGPVEIPAGASVMVRVDKDSQGKMGLFTDEPLSAGNEVVPKEVPLPPDFNATYDNLRDITDELVVTTSSDA